MLDRLYARARVLVAASVGEGFGLPLVEAARNAVPIVARDLPVFREVAGDYAYYFSGMSADDLARALKAWLDLHREGRHPRSEGLPLLTWAESTDELLDIVLGGRWNATWLGADAGTASGAHADVDSSSQAAVRTWDTVRAPCLTESVAPTMTLEMNGAMSAPDNSSGLNTDSSKRRVRDEIPHRCGDAEAPAGTPVDSFVLPRRDLLRGDAFAPVPDLALQPRFERKASGYTIEDFARLQGGAFIRAAYQGLLHREPDPPGLDHFLQRLQRGDSKILILGLIRYSPEGRRLAMRVQGLWWRFLLERACEVPIAGRLIGVVVILARLPTIQKQATQNEGRLAAQLAAVYEHAAATNRATRGMASAALQEQREAIDRFNRALEQQALAVARVASWKTSADERLAAAAAAAARMASWKTSADERLAAGAAAHASVARAAKVLETGVADVAARLKRMEDQADDQKRAGEAFAHAFDDLYAAFEEKFRGERDDIKGRVAVYVPRIVDAELGTSDTPVLDLGCGRGEWLEVLKDRGLWARGVDTNRTMLAQCRAMGLDVTEADALAFLTETPAGSLGAVTGFHIVEHLPLPYLVSMLKETARTLRPGGIAIFETPNPENVLVGSHTFYLDPTHLNPIPPATLKFFIEAAGLHDVELVFLHPSPADERLRTADQAVEAFVNSRFFGPRDYAVIARKA